MDAPKNPGEPNEDTVGYGANAGSRVKRKAYQVDRLLFAVIRFYSNNGFDEG